MMMELDNAHNLDVNMYSLKEILNLFHLDYDISLEDLKRAKKQVLSTHPDKSRLSSEYFLFFKKAFDIVLQFYNNQHKQDADTTHTSTAYSTDGYKNENKHTTKHMQKLVRDMGESKFNDQFNQLFEKNMVNKTDKDKNEWFTSEKEVYEINERVNAGNMGQVIDRVRENQQSVVKHNGVQVLYSNNNTNNNFHDEEDDSYVVSDPFSKLKFDDLRKVHKDQTVLNVSERDFNNVKTYSSVDHFMRERGSQSLTPLEKQEAEKLLQSQDRTYRERMMHKEYESNLKTTRYEEKNKHVMANFLRLTNK
jgi:hypothetical protein|tara:strand:+ start:441 stop:1361 length:921 start_codon:yes stop_codon:yes gene_type:complete